MFDRSAPIIDCDAPPYSIVRACQMIGLESPEDVRWCRLSHLRNGRDHRPLFTLSGWKSFLGMEYEQDGSRCFCRKEAPRLERYTFTFISGRESHYYLGQCRHCRTIFWEGAESEAGALG